jgi:hypothetical protein
MDIAFEDGRVAFYDITMCGLLKANRLHGAITQNSELLITIQMGTYRPEILTAVNVKIKIFWGVMPCSLVLPEEPALSAFSAKGVKTNR